MTRKLFEIVIVLVGLIVGSLASINTSMVTTKVNVVTNQDIFLKFRNGDDAHWLTSVDAEPKSLLPVHFVSGYPKFSPTLSMDNLTGTADDANDNVISTTRSVYLSKASDNTYLQCELVVTGDDAINDAIRVCLLQGSNCYYIKPNEPQLTGIKLTDKQSTASPITFKFYYELEDPSCTIENINAAEGADVTLNLYAYVKEQ